jgi:hypothetical protein
VFFPALEAAKQLFGLDDKPMHLAPSDSALVLEYLKE